MRHNLKSEVIVPTHSTIYPVHKIESGEFDAKTLTYIDRRGMEDIVWYHQTMDIAMRRKVNRLIVERYHIQSRHRDPCKAVEELVIRLFYEMLSFKLHPDDVLYGRWLRCSNRDAKHQIRMRILRSLIRKSKTGMDYMYRWRWVKL